MPASLTSRLWGAIEDIFAAILEHPFIIGLTDGSLPKEKFRYFILQDARYLHSFARALSSVGGRAPTPTDTALFAGRAARAVAVERTLHEGLLMEMGLDERAVAETELSPTTLAYTSYLLSTVHGGSFVDGLSVVLPCYWIYFEVGKTLSERGSPDPLYQRWIDTYGGEEFAEAVSNVLALTDRVGETLGREELARVHEHFITASCYEWMFWNAAWHEERWPLRRGEPASRLQPNSAPLMSSL
jgi:thiaminase/transcriptional activator TenA